MSKVSVLFFGSERVCTETAIEQSTTPLSSGAPSRGPPANIRICLIFLETRIIDPHFAADSICLSSFTFFWCALENDFFHNAFWPFKVIHRSLILVPNESANATSY